MGVSLCNVNTDDRFGICDVCMPYCNVSTIVVVYISTNVTTIVVAYISTNVMLLLLE